MTSRLFVTTPSGDVELTAFTGLKGPPYFDENTSLIELGHDFADGAAHQGTFKFEDPLGTFPRFSVHRVVTWTEDSSGDELWLSRGRVSVFETGRGDVPYDNFVEYDVTVDDGNVDLAYLAFTEAWDRPEETGWERIEALQAYILNSSASTSPTNRASTLITFAADHLAPNSSTVTMPARVYPMGTHPGEIIQECADTEGKVWGVVIHHTGGVSHLCLRYHAEDNHGVHPSPIKISDQLADWNPTDLATPVFEPHWEMGKASIWDGQQVITGLVSRYGPEQAAIFVERAAGVADSEYWIDTYADPDSTTAAQAEDIAEALLLYRGSYHVTHRVSVIMLAEQIPLLTVGQSIEIKAAAAMSGGYLGSYQTRRVAELRWEPRNDGRWWAHMHLDRVPRRRPYRRGGTNVPPAPTPGGSGENVLCGLPSSQLRASGQASGFDFQAVDCNDATYWDTNGFPVAAQHMGIDLLTAQMIGSWRILQSNAAPWAATDVTIWGSNSAAAWTYLSSGYPLSAFGSNGWTPVSTLTGLGLSNNTGSFSPTSFRYWLFDATAGGGNGWVVYELGLFTAGDVTEPVGGTGSGDPGDSGTYSPIDHVHEHGDITTGGPYHMAEDVTFAPTGTIAATDVQAAIAEVAAEAGGAPTAADYLVGTAQAGLSAEIVVGTTPGGELGGTWASPTVDATHSGSAHVTALDGLSDATITAPAEDDTLRYVGGQWVNDNRRWEAVTDGEDVFVWDGDELLHEWKDY